MAELSGKTLAITGAAERLGRLDVLINNAGLMLLGPVESGDPEDRRRIANAVTYAVSQPQRVSINEVLIRPTGQTR